MNTVYLEVLEQTGCNIY